MGLKRRLMENGRIVPKRLIAYLEELESASSGGSTDISALESVVGDKDSGLVKDVADVKKAIGTNADANSIVGKISSMDNTIGSEDNPNSILGRIKALEDS